VSVERIGELEDGCSLHRPHSRALSRKGWMPWDGTEVPRLWLLSRAESWRYEFILKRETWKYAFKAGVARLLFCRPKMGDDSLERDAGSQSSCCCCY